MNWNSSTSTTAWTFQLSFNMSIEKNDTLLRIKSPSSQTHTKEGKIGINRSCPWDEDTKFNIGKHPSYILSSTPAEKSSLVHFRKYLNIMIHLILPDSLSSPLRSRSVVRVRTESPDPFPPGVETDSNDTLYCVEFVSCQLISLQFASP